MRIIISHSHARILYLLVSVFDLIDLSHNSLTGSVPEWFTGLFSRQELVCHHNFLTGPVPGVSSTAIAEFLSDPESLESVRLKRVDMAHNMMTGMCVRR